MTKQTIQEEQKKSARDLVRDQVRRSINSGFDDDGRRGETAIKLYFYPASAAVFSQDEFEDFTMPDLVTVKKAKVNEVVKALGKRLTLLIAEAFESTGAYLGDQYLSVVVYGMVGGPDLIVYHFTGDGVEDVELTGTAIVGA